MYKFFNSKNKFSNLSPLISKIQMIYSLNKNPNYYFSLKIHPMSVETNIPTHSYDTDKIRNIGIIAHIDAGKTTTTERMLFYSGVIDSPGEVHHGNTVTDYMEQERQRGITIRAAAISFDWKEYQINLIDTPGHIDFTAEVERSLRVLDGAVVILDASMGVETQTITVWKQANKYSLPRIAFINKIDKAGASVENTLIAMHRRLGVRSILINYPTGEENLFSGLIDLITFKLINFKDAQGLEHETVDIPHSNLHYKKYVKLRETLIEEIASLDEEIMNLYLEGQEIPPDVLIQCIRKLLCDNKITIVLCGSSLKNKGVQQLLDSIVAFFPSPYDAPPIKAKKLNSIEKSENSVILKHCTNKNSKACGLIFKIINDKEKGTIAFFKLYEGVLKNRSYIKYTNKNPITKERIVQILRMKADECLQLSEINAGDIGAIIGLKEAKSGDTIVDDSETELTVLPGVFNPDPVFFCSITPKRNSDYRTLISILENMTREDPSVQVKYDKDTAQTLICGLGELHLEIVKDRIELEHGISSNLGKMKVSFKESLRKNLRSKFTMEKEFNGQLIFFEVELEVYPIEVDYVSIDPNSEDFDISKMFDKEETNKPESLPENLNNNQESISESVDNQPHFQGKKFLFNLSKYRSEGFDIKIDEENPLQLNIKFNKSQVVFDFEKLPKQTTTVKYDNGDEEVFKTLNLLSSEDKRTLFQCVLESLNSGSLLGYPLTNVGVRIISGKYSTSRTNDFAVKMGISESMKNLIKSADPVFMEPYMLLEVVVPNYCSSQIISDLTSNRRGKIISIICENETKVKDNNSISQNNFLYEFLLTEHKNSIKLTNDDIISKVYAVAPLSELVGYAAYIRSISKGEGKYFMKFQEYDTVGPVLQGKILDGTYFYE